MSSKIMYTSICASPALVCGVACVWRCQHVAEHPFERAPFEHDSFACRSHHTYRSALNCSTRAKTSIREAGRHRASSGQRKTHGSVTNMQLERMHAHAHTQLQLRAHKISLARHRMVWLKTTYTTTSGRRQNTCIPTHKNATKAFV